MNTEPEYEITPEGYALLAALKAPPACGECDFCVCVDKEADE